MVQQEKPKLEPETKESRISRQIKSTKTSFSLDDIAARYLKKSGVPDPISYEYNFSNTTSFIIRHYIWLSVKLVALYLAKWFNWLVCRK